MESHSCRGEGKEKSSLALLNSDQLHRSEDKMNLYRGMLSGPSMLLGSCLASYLESRGYSAASFAVWSITAWVNVDIAYVLHDHSHGAFSRNRTENKALDISMGIAAGTARSHWELTHIKGHHNLQAEYTGALSEKEKQELPTWKTIFNYAVRTLVPIISDPIKESFQKMGKSFEYIDAHGQKVIKQYSAAFYDQIISLAGVITLSAIDQRNILFYLFVYFVTRSTDYVNHMGDQGFKELGYVLAEIQFNVARNCFGLHAAHHRENTHWADTPKKLLDMIENGEITIDDAVPPKQKASWIGGDITLPGILAYLGLHPLQKDKKQMENLKKIEEKLKEK